MLGSSHLKTEGYVFKGLQFLDNLETILDCHYIYQDLTN